MFDSDQEIFDCPFCGNRYDIVDFHAGEVLEQANACLKQEAFSAAKEKFGQILDNEPQNFDALLGNVLCVLNLDSAERLENSDNLSGRDLTGAKKAILSAKRLSSGAKADYFAKMISLIESYEKIIRFEREKRELLSGDTRNELNQKLLSDFRKYRSDERWASLNGIPGLFKIMGVLIFVDVFVCFCAYLFNFNGVFLSFGLLIGAAILFICWLTRKDKKHDEDFDPAYEYEKRLKNRILELDRTYTTAYRNMKDLMGEFAPEDKAPKVVSESVPASGNDKDAPKDVFCAKCGAMLGLDMGKRVYQCDHCGVAYGVSLFFGMPMGFRVFLWPSLLILKLFSEESFARVNGQKSAVSVSPMRSMKLIFNRSEPFLKKTYSMHLTRISRILEKCPNSCLISGRTGKTENSLNY